MIAAVALKMLYESFSTQSAAFGKPRKRQSLDCHRKRGIGKAQSALCLLISTRGF